MANARYHEYKWALRIRLVNGIVPKENRNNPFMVDLQNTVMLFDSREEARAWCRTFPKHVTVKVRVEINETL